MNPDDHGRPFAAEELLAAPGVTRVRAGGGQRYRIEWMGKDGAYEQRWYGMDDVLIGTQDGALIVTTNSTSRPALLLAVPVQRVVQVELVGQ